MDPLSILVLFAFVIGYSLLTIAFDRCMHNYVRPNFALGVMIAGLSICGLIFLVFAHPNDHSKASSLMFVAFLILVMVGKLLIDKNNIDDQNAGRMSKWGTWWDGWDNNYFYNIIDKWETWAVIAFLGFAGFNIAMRSEFDESFTASSNPSPSTASATQSATIKTAHHTVTRVHHVAHRTHGATPQTHHSAPKGHHTQIH